MSRVSPQQLQQYNTSPMHSKIHETLFIWSTRPCHVIFDRTETILFVKNIPPRLHRIPEVFHVHRNPRVLQVFQICGHSAHFLPWTKTCNGNSLSCWTTTSVEQASGFIILDNYLCFRRPLWDTFVWPKVVAYSKLLRFRHHIYIFLLTCIHKHTHTHSSQRKNSHHTQTHTLMGR